MTWLTLDITVPKGSYEGAMDAYIVMEAPNGSWSFLQGILSRESMPFDIIAS